MTPVFARAAAAPALAAAYDRLIGPGRWIQRVELGVVPIRFPLDRESSAAGALDDPARPEVLATGDAGDVFLCHPFLIHAAQVNRAGRPRFMSQPGIMLREQFDLGDPTSPVERAIVDALGREAPGTRRR
ncbi:hypothetical protein ACXVUM_02710 [Williamsia sp. SKLECPSW1]